MTTDGRRGWSSSPYRKAMRFLARIPSSRMATLPPNRTIASITFDDVPNSAAANGAPVLEKYGARGTFYIAAGTCGKRDELWTLVSKEQVRDLYNAGHEIGCHTANHLNVQFLGRKSLWLECETNQSLLRDICGGALTLSSFAYPFGDLGVRQRLQLEKRFNSCRSIYEFFNSGRVSLGRVGAIGLFDATIDRERLKALIGEASARGGWLVFYTHDVEDTPTHIGTSPRLLNDTLAMLGDAGIPVLTMADALRALRQNDVQGC